MNPNNCVLNTENGRKAVPEDVFSKSPNIFSMVLDDDKSPNFNVNNENSPEEEENPISIALQTMLMKNEEKIQQIRKCKEELEKEEMAVSLLYETSFNRTNSADVVEIRKILCELQYDCNKINEQKIREMYQVEELEKDVISSVYLIEENEMKYDNIQKLRDINYDAMVQAHEKLLEPMIEIRERYFLSNEDILSSYNNIQFMKNHTCHEHQYKHDNELAENIQEMRSLSKQNNNELNSKLEEYKQLNLMYP